MITERELRAAIAECQGKRNPDAGTCIKMAAYYTLLDALYPAETHSYSAGPDVQINSKPDVQINSKSEFAGVVNGKKQEDVWPVIDELMATIHVVQPRLYSAVLQKLY